MHLEQKTVTVDLALTTESGRLRREEREMRGEKYLTDG